MGDTNLDPYARSRALHRHDINGSFFQSSEAQRHVGDVILALEFRALAAEAERESTMRLLADAIAGCDEQRARADRAEAERDALRRHFEAAAPEHNLLALFDLYESRATAAESERDTLRAALRGADEEIGRLRGVVRDTAKAVCGWHCGVMGQAAVSTHSATCDRVRAALSTRLTVEVEPTLPTHGTPGPVALAALERCRERLAADGARVEELGAAAECRVCHAPQPGPHKMSCRPRDRERMAQPTRIGDGEGEGKP